MSESPKGVLLVVDDEPLKRVTLQIELSEAGYTVLEASDAAAALRQLEGRPVDVVITDVRMPGMDGIQFLERVKSEYPQTHVILITAFATVDAAVDAIKRGAYDYLAKPFATGQLMEKIERLLVCRQQCAGERGAEVEQIGSLIGRSYAARRMFERIRAVASSDSPVMIQGESGTCRERVAEAIHGLSGRSEQSMIRFSCDAGTAESIDAALFGFCGGGPGGASPTESGRFELAAGGSLFLDHVDALPAEIQSKLLRTLEEGVAERVGDGARIGVEARLLCGSERDLRTLVNEGVFLKDLYYRLDALNVVVPPLRERREDVPVLAQHYLTACAANADGRGGPRRIQPGAMDLLVNHHWPGNVRELEHVMERATAFAQGDEIQPRDIQLPADRTAAETAPGDGEATGLTETVAGVERTLIDAALRRAAGNQAKAAQFLGIPRTTLRDKMTKYGMMTRATRGEMAS